MESVARASAAMPPRAPGCSCSVVLVPCQLLQESRGDQTSGRPFSWDLHPGKVIRPFLRLRRITTIPHVAAPSGNDHQALTARSAPTPDVGVLARTSRRSVRTRSKKPAVRPRERERESAPAAARCCRTGIRQPGAGLSATSSPQARVQQLCDGSASPGSVSICGSATASSGDDACCVAARLGHTAARTSLPLPRGRRRRRALPGPAAPSCGSSPGGSSFGGSPCRPGTACTYPSE